MRCAHHVLAGCLGALLLGSIVKAANLRVADSQVVDGMWQLHTAKVSYVGFTSYYTCSGLEDHVRAILIHLGARRDAKVRATGCADGPNRPSQTAWIAAEFSTLAPTDNLAGPDIVKAYWAPREISPRRPIFMDEGDCELIDQLKHTISSAFTLKHLEYRTDCIPHQALMDGFRVTGEALLPVPTLKNAGEPR